VIRAGHCEVRRDDVCVVTLSPGDSFGEVALLLDAPSPIAVVTTSDVELLSVPQEEFRQLAARNDVRAALEAVASRYGITRAGVAAAQAEDRRLARPLLARWFGEGGSGATASDATAAALQAALDGLVGAASCEAYAEGEVVEIEPGRLRFVQAGECAVMGAGLELRRLHPGDVFLGPDRAPEGERVVARSFEVRVCSIDFDAVRAAAASAGGQAALDLPELLLPGPQAAAPATW